MRFAQNSMRFAQNSMVFAQRVLLTNFILFKITRDKLSSSSVTRALGRRSVFVKDFGSNPLLKNCIRVTVGQRNMNERFLGALREVTED
jgi:histidinol-phosphate/aromatic aminotransferase/cobyric acid decarboxylase-like protein